MGDSFVEGTSVNYEDTFVGMFAKEKIMQKWLV